MSEIHFAVKTRRLKLIASILLIAVMSFSISQAVNAVLDFKERTSKKADFMTFDQAILNPGILQAMYDQVDDKILQHNWSYHTSQIQFEGIIIYIHASFEQWHYFFQNQHIYKKTKKK